LTIVQVNRPKLRNGKYFHSNDAEQRISDKEKYSIYIRAEITSALETQLESPKTGWKGENWNIFETT